MPFGDIHLDSNLITDMLGHPAAAPPLHSGDVRLRQNTHPTSVQPVPLQRWLKSAYFFMATDNSPAGGSFMTAASAGSAPDALPFPGPYGSMRGTAPSPQRRWQRTQAWPTRLMPTGVDQTRRAPDFSVDPDTASSDRGSIGGCFAGMPGANARDTGDVNGDQDMARLTQPENGRAGVLVKQLIHKPLAAFKIMVD